MEPNWGTVSQNPEYNYKIILSKSLSHFLFWRWNSQDRLFTVLTKFLTRNQLASQLYYTPHITRLRCWKFYFSLRIEAQSRKLSKPKSCIFKSLSHFQIWNSLNTFDPAKTVSKVYLTVFAESLVKFVVVVSVKW